MLDGDFGLPCPAVDAALRPALPVSRVGDGTETEPPILLVDFAACVVPALLHGDEAGSGDFFLALDPASRGFDRANDAPTSAIVGETARCREMDIETDTSWRRRAVTLSRGLTMRGDVGPLGATHL